MCKHHFTVFQRCSPNLNKSKQQFFDHLLHPIAEQWTVSFSNESSVKPTNFKTGLAVSKLSKQMPADWRIYYIIWHIKLINKIVFKQPAF